MFDVANDPAMQLYNGYFGGGMNSIVFQEMRERARWHTRLTHICRRA